MSETKRKRVRQPSPLRIGDGSWAAWAWDYNRGMRCIKIDPDYWDELDATRLYKWLIRAAAWVKDGKR